MGPVVRALGSLAARHLGCPVGGPDAGTPDYGRGRFPGPGRQRRCCPDAIPVSKW
ncbi:hypothetical protein H1P_6430009 [Hyella patelloides LEGE 07179]|uniref:Uncharacterized protein n=1 Tax=Hyella patelloides LEGE 07179 TaxID=945734 RepID=A0A563W2M5_9CYAN|nr:hypothetical protein H1P_6430009 [Hyella patelloides LEGE 07179]